MAAEAHPLRAQELARELGDSAWFLISIAHEVETGRATSVAEAKLLNELSTGVIRRARDWAKEISQGVPLQYVTGRADFLGHVYEIERGVLIPRPETEVFVLEAIRRLKNPSRGFEWGVGSGIIAIELLSHFKSLQMVAIDVSEKARMLALRNAERLLGPSPSRLKIRAEWASEDRELDFVISNPPYLDRSSCNEYEAQVGEHEPAEALFAPEHDLLAHYREIREESRDRIKSGGLLLLEVPHERALDIQKLFADKAWQRAELLPDLTGRPRICVVRRT